MASDSPGFDPILLPAVISINTSLGGALLCFALYILRSGSADIADLTSDFPELEHRLNSVNLSRSFQWVMLILIAGIYYGFLISAEFSLFPDRSLPERWSVIAGTRVPFLLYFVATPILTFGTWIFTVVYWQQLRALILLARNLPLEISQLIRYQQISNPFVRLVVVFSFLSTLFPIALFVPSEVPTEAVFGALMASSAFIAVCIAYFVPVTILRNRIRDLLFDAQLAVAQEMKDESLSAQDYERLMVKQMYLESRWEWPLASNVQKIIVFVLLPPFAWVMAAAVENFLF